MTQTSDVILDRMMALHPKVIDLTLDRMWRLLNALGNPQDRLPPVIHIAGTNGKGSTQAMIRAGLEGAGKTVHAYTSPHLARFHERIRLAGDLISEPRLTEYLDRCYAANDGASITYFEITTCAALLAFSETPADYLLLEVGLGGRLDATNAIDAPALSIITPVDLDHQQFLGDTIAQIAGEKAGIIKRRTPCIVAPQKPTALEVIEHKAAQNMAPLFAHGQQWHVSVERDRLIFQDENGLLDLPLPALRGPHQIQNAGTALAALRVLEAGEAAYEAAMTHAHWPARMQRLSEGALPNAYPNHEIWLDGGHNPAAGLALAHTLQHLPKRPTVAICGMINTKDIAGYLQSLAQQVNHLIALKIPGEPNAVPADDIMKTAQQFGIAASVTNDLQTAMIAASQHRPQSRILICGSLYLAGHVLRMNDGA